MSRIRDRMGLPLAACLVASLMLGASFAAPRRAAAATSPGITTLLVTPTTLVAGGQVKITATGFAASEKIAVTVSPQSAALATLQADANGALTSVAVTIPATFAAGTHTLTLTGLTSHRVAEYQHIALTQATPTLAVTPPVQAPGGKLQISGTGFAASEMVGVFFSPQTTPITTIQAGSNGAISNAIVALPMTTTLGLHTLHLQGMTSRRATTSATITVGTSLTVTPLTLAPGSILDLSGAGFAANEAVTVTISAHNGAVVTLKADSFGVVASTPVTVPAALSAGAHTLMLTGATSHRTVSVRLTLTAVQATLQALQPAAAAGKQITFSGSNWASKEAVTLTISGSTQPLGVLHADANGNLITAPITIPSSTVARGYVITATGALSKRTATASLTVVPAAATVVAITPATTNRGGLITVSGSNFAPNESITVMIPGVSAPLATLKANAQGQLTPTGVSIPFGVSLGAHVLQISGATSKRTATATISVAALSPSISANMASASPGKTVTVAGKGFGRQEQVTLSLNGAALVTTPAAITTTNGAFTATFKVPGSLLRGANTLSAIGNQSRVSASGTISGLLPVASTLYFAGGSTMAGEQALLAVLNPNAQSAHLDLTFYYQTGAPGHASVDVGPHSRGTVNLNVLAGANRTFGLMMTGDRSVTAQLRVLRDNKDGYGLLGVSAPSTTWYLAEGYTGSTFHETLDLVNPGLAAAQVQLRLLPFGGRAARTVLVSVAPQSAQTVDVNTLMPHQSLSVIATASQPIVLARKLTFGVVGNGVTAKTGINTPATSWIFSEGAASASFETYLTVLNPNTVGTYVTASFYGQTGGSLGSRTVYVPGLSRANIKLNNFLRSSNIASVVSSNIPVVVERPEYVGTPNRVGAAGSDVFGRNGAGLSWTFPGGDTAMHNMALRIYNPSVRTVRINATFYGADGHMMTKQIAVPPTVQYIVAVRALVPGLAAQYGIVLRSANGLGFIAEQTSSSPSYSAIQSTQGFAS